MISSFYKGELLFLHLRAPGDANGFVWWDAHKWCPWAQESGPKGSRKSSTTIYVYSPIGLKVCSTPSAYHSRSHPLIILLF